MSLIEKLKAGKKNVKVIRWPGTDDEIGITILAEAETQEALFAAERLFKEAGIEVTATTINAYNSEVNTQTLFRALVDSSRKKPDGTHERYFKGIDEFRSLLHREAKEILIEEYNAFEDECNPSPAKLSDEELEKILEDVKKNSHPGTNLSFGTLRQLVAYLASRPSSSQKASGSISSA